MTYVYSSKFTTGRMVLIGLRAILAVFILFDNSKDRQTVDSG